ncbi:FliH/SctL family protein [Diaminobutyricimonas sp. LJ205]|uniref:FliH/SctL family protein n=1 Tax=Diaminobutyricimonas sp. LJ205 TaxID=2683590 RepID=UPI0012F498D6|nr:FliH/SctL family protein [Diaminobutyricimonas sp. LJ205]
MSTEVFSKLTFPALADPQSERIELQARSRGHAAGYADGLRAAEAEVAALKDRLATENLLEQQRAREQRDRAEMMLARAAGALDAATVPVIADVQRTLAEAAIELAEAILGYELEHGERTARAALDRALSPVDVATAHRVRMHPTDLARLDAGTGDRAGIELVADPAIEAGGAITEFADGYLDARISTALARAKAALLAEVAE